VGFGLMVEKWNLYAEFIIKKMKSDIKKIILFILYENE